MVQVIMWVAQVLVCNATHAVWLKQLDIYIYMYLAQVIMWVAQLWLKSLCIKKTCFVFDLLNRPLRSTIVWIICKNYYSSRSVNASSSSPSFPSSMFEHRGASSI